MLSGGEVVLLASGAPNPYRTGGGVAVRVGTKPTHQAGGGENQYRAYLTRNNGLITIHIYISLYTYLYVYISMMR